MSWWRGFPRPFAWPASPEPEMAAAPILKIAILDDDHVIRIARYALSGPGEVSESYVRDFFLPEEMDAARVLETGRGLHASDGVSLIPMMVGMFACSGVRRCST